MSLLTAWILAGIGFVIIEMMTATLYGASLAIGAFVVAIYVWFTGETELRVLQSLIFLIISGIGCILLPRWINGLKSEEFKTGLEVSIGRSVALKKVGSDWKVVIDGVDYLVEDSCVTPEFKVGAKAIIASHSSGVVTVELIPTK